jgi:hypothetical protein
MQIDIFVVSEPVPCRDFFSKASKQTNSETPTGDDSEAVGLSVEYDDT